MKHRMKLLKITEQYFEFESDSTEEDQILIDAWHALDEHDVVWKGSVQREKLMFDKE